MIKFKEGCKVDLNVYYFNFEYVLKLFNAEHCPDKDIYITAGTNGLHKKGSLHPKGKAWDVRTWNLTDELRDQMLEYLTEKLQDYDVLYEPEVRDDKGNITKGAHIHAEYDPHVNHYVA